VIWWDESEGDGVAATTDDFTHTIGEIDFDRAHPNVNDRHASPVNYTHSSDLRTWQNVFHAGPCGRRGGCGGPSICSSPSGAEEAGRTVCGAWFTGAEDFFRARSFCGGERE
jgi:hypothetical protein